MVKSSREPARPRHLLAGDQVAPPGQPDGPLRRVERITRHHRAATRPRIYYYRIHLAPAPDQPSHYDIEPRTHLAAVLGPRPATHGFTPAQQRAWQLIATGTVTVDPAGFGLLDGVPVIKPITLASLGDRITVLPDRTVRPATPSGDHP